MSAIGAAVWCGAHPCPPRTRSPPPAVAAHRPSVRTPTPLLRWGRPIAAHRLLSPKLSCSPSSPAPEDPAPVVRLGFDPSRKLLGLDVDPPHSRDPISNTTKLRSWFGPNGQYIRELPCPSCRGRGYTPCTECGIEQSRVDCTECNGKGLKTCQQCFGDRVIWEESIDERPWETARSSSPFKVKEDDEVDKLEIKADVTRRSKRVYRSPPPEVGKKISQSLRILNAKTGLFSKRMKILHRDPKLHAERVAAIKKAKGTEAARKQASVKMKAFFSNFQNRLERSIAMKGVKFKCGLCGEEGHRRHYCPSLNTESKQGAFRCRLCGGSGHNRRTCGKQLTRDQREPSRRHKCRICGEPGHNSRTCNQLMNARLTDLDARSGSRFTASGNGQTRLCSLCLQPGHNARTCPRRKPC